MTATDRASFLAAIIAEPEDNTPRLVYCDWLDENGDEADRARAEFIRVQCELAAMLKDINPIHHNGLDMILDPQSREDTEWRDEVHRLQRRERELLTRNVGSWTDELPECLVMTECPSCVDKAADWETNVVECSRCDCTGLIFTDDNIEFRRGFVGSATIDWSDWRQYHAALLAAAPITRVAFTTWPELEYVAYVAKGDRCRLRGCQRMIAWNSATLQASAVSHLLALEWPRIREWTLPTEGH